LAVDKNVRNKDQLVKLNLAPLVKQVMVACPVLVTAIAHS
jgi:hypothetical protein